MAEEIMQDKPLSAEQIEQKKIDDMWTRIDAKCTELSAANKGREIVPIVIPDTDKGDYVIGYMYSLDAITDAKMYGAKLSGPEVSIPKAIQALESLIIWDASDARLKLKKFMNGATLVLLRTVESSMPVFKKK